MVVRNTCKSGLKMNRKTPILDPPRRSITPNVIDLKFGTRDYDVGAIQHAKTYNSRSSRGHSRGVKCDVQRLYLLVLAGAVLITGKYEFNYRYCCVND